MPEQAISFVIEESFWRIDRKALARRATNQNVQRSFSQFKLSPQFRSVNFLDRAVVRECPWVVSSEGFNRPPVDIVGVEALESSALKAFCDTSGTAEYVDGPETARAAFSNSV